MSQNTPAWVELSILERVLKYDWSKEAIIFGSILVFVALHYWGSTANKNKVEGWIKSHREVLDAEFAQVGTTASTTFVKESPTVFASWATGRQNIDSLLATFTLKGRQNLITLSIEYVLGFFFGLPAPADTIDITITPNKKAPISSFVFAIVNKEIMKRAREDNYYLSLTRTTDSEKLPVNFVFMSENPEVTNSFFTPEIAEAVQTSQNVLELLAVSDQGKSRPEKVEEVAPKPSLTLSLKFPSNSEEAAISAKLLQAAIRLIDLAAEKTLRPEVARKIKATRESEVKKIVKAQEEEKAEELAQKKADEKREQRNRIAKLSPAEQRKYEEKERKKEQKKLQKQQMVRG